MERNGDSLPFLRYLGDKSHNLFMQNADECLEVQDPTLQEPIFTEIDDVAGWSASGYPVFYGSLITEDGEVELGDRIESVEQIQDNTNAEIVEEDCAISGSVVSENGLMTADGLFVSNELLFQLKTTSNGNTNGAVIEEQLVSDANINEITEGNEELEMEISTDVDQSSEGLEWNDIDVIRMLNNGSIIAVDRSTLNTVTISAPDADVNTGESETTYSKLFEEITALKCKLCGFLCEEQQQIFKHLKSVHISRMTENCYVDKAKNGLSKPLIKTVEMKSILSVNRNKETKQTVYLCSECNMGYASKNLLKEHMIANHNLVNLSEININTDTVDNSQQPETEPKSKSFTEVLTNLAMKQYKASKRIKCTIKGCELKFPKNDARLNHESCHDNEQKKQFKCPHCAEKFSVWRMCSSHLWKCHNVDLGLLSCPKCKFKSASFSRLKVHLAIHDDVHPFVCHECGKGFKQLSQLKNHQVIHKNPETDEIPDWASQKQCNICKKYFANSKTLKKHVQIVHDKFKPFICNICGHKTARKSMLNLHLRQHTGEKPHQCPVCVYKTGDPNSLRRHIMRHEGETKYSCPHCEYQSIQSTSYKNHVAAKHPGKGGTFYCSACSYHTVSETTFFNHKLEHSKNKANTNCEAAAQAFQTDEINGTSDTNHVLQQGLEAEDDDTQNCFLNTDVPDETIDTGGITIPAGFELQVSL